MTDEKYTPCGYPRDDYILKLKQDKEYPIPCQSPTFRQRGMPMKCSGKHGVDKDGYATLPCGTCGFDLMKKEDE